MKAGQHGGSGKFCIATNLQGKPCCEHKADVGAPYCKHHKISGYIPSRGPPSTRRENTRCKQGFAARIHYPALGQAET